MTEFSNIDPIPYLIRFCQLLMALVLVIAGSAKLVRQQAFLDSVLRFELVPPIFARAVALLMPVFEIGVGVALVLRFLPEAASALALILMLIFTAVIAITLARGKDVSCGCFGSSHDSRVSGRTLVRNLILVAIATIPLVFIHPTNSPVTPTDDLLLIGIALAVVAVTKLLGLVGKLWSHEVAT